MAKRTAKLAVGDVIELKPGHAFYARVPERLLYTNRPNPDALARGVVCIGGTVDPDGAFAGRYVVIRTALDGGSSGGGMNGHDDYPNGHHVFCENLADPSVRVDFYQSGCFTAMIPDIAPVGRMVVATLAFAREDVEALSEVIADAAIRRDEMGQRGHPDPVVEQAERLYAKLDALLAPEEYPKS